MPVLGAWGGPELFVVSKDSTRKSKNLQRNASCVVTADSGDLHLVVEGNARRITDAETLQRASEAFLATRGWSTTIAGSQLDADFGAPTSGGPPYDVYAIMPSKAFAFPVDGESATPTRWQFRSLEGGGSLCKGAGDAGCRDRRSGL
jgi:hypothetical protein